MTTDGTKMVYSWDDSKGEITQKTETVKSYSNNLENPLDGKTMLESQNKYFHRHKCHKSV
jgi:hypothetical protein